MARSLVAKGKLVRKFGCNIYGQDKFDRLLERHPNPPGQHGGRAGRKRLSNYGQQLLEKQKLKHSYGLLEKQFRRIFARAQQQSGVTSDNLLHLLEMRLDNAVYRAGLASSRAQARQLVNHGHLRLNRRKVDIPSCVVSPGDRIEVRDKESSKRLLRRTAAEQPAFRSANWIEADREHLAFIIKSHPDAAEVAPDINLQLIIEYYSR